MRSVACALEPGRCPYCGILRRALNLMNWGASEPGEIYLRSIAWDLEPGQYASRGILRRALNLDVAVIRGFSGCLQASGF